MEGSGPAWELVRAAAVRSGVSIVGLDRLEDADRVRSVIEGVWGEQVLPREMVRAFQHAGSVLYGAETGGRLMGFVLGFAGLSGGLHLHSHMLATMPEWQNRGVGFALKLAQRARCLDQGVEEIRWTYDPMQARNAKLNLVKLGAEAFRLLPNFYGEMTDRLNRDDRSDRFEVRWRLASARVEQALRGRAQPPDPGPSLLASQDPGRGGEPAATPAVPVRGATVSIPGDYQELKARSPDVAMRWRDQAAEAFQSCFDAGLVASWFAADGAYVFERPEDLS